MSFLSCIHPELYWCCHPVKHFLLQITCHLYLPVSVSSRVHLQMQHVLFSLSCRVGHNEVIGVCRVGNEAESLGRDHWNEMMTYPRKPIAHWHPLIEVRTTLCIVTANSCKCCKLGFIRNSHVMQSSKKSSAMLISLIGVNLTQWCFDLQANVSLLTMTMWACFCLAKC